MWGEKSDIPAYMYCNLFIDEMEEKSTIYSHSQTNHVGITQQRRFSGFSRNW